VQHVKQSSLSAFDQKWVGASRGTGRPRLTGARRRGGADRLPGPDGQAPGQRLHAGTLPGALSPIRRRLIGDDSILTRPRSNSTRSALRRQDGLLRLTDRQICGVGRRAIAVRQRLRGGRIPSLYDLTSSIGAPVAARSTDSQPFFAAALVS
jgi:hypothetical protein